MSEPPVPRQFLQPCAAQFREVCSPCARPAHDGQQSHAVSRGEPAVKVDQGRDPASSEEFEPVPLSDYPTIASREGFKLVQGVHVEGISRSSRSALAAIAKGCPKLEQLAPDIQNAIHHPNRHYRLQRSRLSGEFTLTAAKAFKAGDVVAVVGASMTTRRRWDRQLGKDHTHPRHIWSYNVSADEVREHMASTQHRGRVPTYQGPDLVLSQAEQANFTRFTLDARWRATGCENNVSPELVMVQQTVASPSSGTLEQLAVPYIVFRAVDRIKKNQELFLDYGDDCWLSFCKIQVMRRGAHNAWAIHLMRRKLEVLCQQHAVEPDLRAVGQGGGHTHQLSSFAATANTSVPSTQAVKGDSAANPVQSSGGGECLLPASASADVIAAAAETWMGGLGGASATESKPAGDCGTRIERPDDSGALKGMVRKQPAQQPQPRRRKGKGKKRKRPQSSAGTGTGSEVDSGIDSDVFREMCDEEVLQVFPGLTHTLVNNLPNSVKQRLRQCESRRQLTRAEQRVIETGAVPSCVVVEVVGMDHPVRWCSLPGSQVCGLCARKLLPRDQPIAAYLGVMSTEQDFSLKYEGRNMQPEDQAYAFDIHADQLRATCKRVPRDLPTLVVESKMTGNEARFVNCAWGSQSSGEVLNARFEIVFDVRNDTPYIVLYANRDILPGEEIIADYGNSYWLNMARHVQKVQFKYEQEQREVCEALAHGLVSAGVLQRGDLSTLYDQAYLEVTQLKTSTEIDEFVQRSVSGMMSAEVASAGATGSKGHAQAQAAAPQLTQGTQTQSQGRDPAASPQQYSPHRPGHQNISQPEVGSEGVAAPSASMAKQQSVESSGSHWQSVAPLKHVTQALPKPGYPTALRQHQHHQARGRDSLPTIPVCDGDTKSAEGIVRAAVQSPRISKEVAPAVKRLSSHSVTEAAWSTWPGSLQ